jgi:3-deoxy-D-manno-octulosonate 8-phosphate phosphatase (KDO 8-P phosphatase)
VNPTAQFLAKREHFDGVVIRLKDKRKILDFLATEYGINENEVMFVFDDVLDVSLAKRCAIRFLVKHSATALFKDFLLSRNIVDFVTNCEGGDHAVREVSEFVLSQMGLLHRTFEERIDFSRTYTDYLESRQNIETAIFEMKENFEFSRLN